MSIVPIRFHLTWLQKEIFEARKTHRWLVAILGRRSGKTTIAIERLIQSCWDNPRPQEWPVAYIAPTYRQAKRIAWKRFKQKFGKDEAVFKESELAILHKPTGCTIYLLGCDSNAESIRGIGLWDAVVDELKDISKTFLTEVLRPCFSDTGGRCLFIGTPPKTKGVSYEYFRRGIDPDYPDWLSWNYGSAQAGLLGEAEIQAARQELDSDTFHREYGAAFYFLQGLVVKHFSKENIRDVAYDPAHRLHIACDFNVDPCMWAIGQRFYGGRYHFIDEIVRENTTILEMADEFARRYPVGLVRSGITINGDASGNNRHVSAQFSNATSYTILRNRLIQHGYTDVRLSVRDRNPAPNDRIEAYNAKIMNADGQCSVFIHPRCKWLIYNHENVSWMEGSDPPQVDKPTVNDIRKDRQKKFLIHILEAAQYMVEFYDPIRHEPVQMDAGTIAPDLEFWV